MKNAFRIISWMSLVASMVIADGSELYKKGAALFKEAPEQALELFEQAADAGNVSAMVGAGHCYESGAGAPVDYAKAIVFYEQAVKQNSLKACEGLARIYASCPDPEFHDGEKAVKFASAYARNNARDGDALALLAAAYARNVEFEKAVKASLKSNSVSASTEAKRRTEEYLIGCPYPERSTDFWMEKAAKGGSVWAMRQRAKQHLTEGRTSESRQLYEKMGKNRGAEDTVALAGYLVRGLGGEKDVEAAIDLLVAAGKQGSMEAYQELGDIYMFGKGGRRKVSMALRYYERIPEPERDAITKYICSSYEHPFYQKRYESQSPEELHGASMARFRGGPGSYEDSDGVSRSTDVQPHPIASLFFALAAAEQGETGSRVQLGSMIRVESMYFNGETGSGKCLAGTEVLPDHKKAEEWYERLKASGTKQIPKRNYNQ